jgi:uncharacterized protein (TIGR00290 family)
MSQLKAVVAWSSGKDSAFALHVARGAGDVEIVGLLTTVTSTFGRVSMHAVREELLDLQAQALGLACRKVSIPWPCPNETYEREMALALAAERARGVSRVIFGDLFLVDIRAYRESRLAGTGIEPLFPLWGRDTRALAYEMLASGLRAIITCVDPHELDRAFAGRQLDESFLADLPAGVDPCGEKGEFHTFAWAGPMFQRPVTVTAGEIVEREGFVFADLLAAEPGAAVGRHPPAGPALALGRHAF